jgi:hypothetical protein
MWGPSGSDLPATVLQILITLVIIEVGPATLPATNRKRYISGSGMLNHGSRQRTNDRVLGLAVFLKQPGFDGFEGGQVEQRKSVVRFAVTENFNKGCRHERKLTETLNPWRVFCPAELGVSKAGL